MTHFDVIIIGGGINGAGIARDATLRGLKTLIVDKNDFASGTSSRSTKLVHGGIRYLEHYQWKLVWEACHERKTLTRIAPHLVKPMPFIIPVYKGDKRSAFLIKFGMFLYDLMAGFQNIRWHKNLSAKKIGHLIPNIKREGLRGGGIYYDCQTDDSRLTLANIQDAVRHSAVAKNYTEVATIKAHEKGWEVVCQDLITMEKYTYTTRYIVNATGPWSDLNLQKWNMDPEKNLRLTKGIHFFIPRLTENYAVLIGAQRDERIFFVIPYGELSLVGTTDTDYQESPDKVSVTDEDRDYLLKELHHLFPSRNLSRKDIIGEYAGLRPLVKAHSIKEGAVSREYYLKETKQGDKSFISVIGGKLTTYRNLAEKVTRGIVKTLQKGNRRPQTAQKRLPGSQYPDKSFLDFKMRIMHDTLELVHLPSDISENLINTYGSEIFNFLPYLKNSSQGLPNPTSRIIPEHPFIWAQLYYGIDHEFIRTAEDFVARRTELYIYAKKRPNFTERVSDTLKAYAERDVTFTV